MLVESLKVFLYLIVLVIVISFLETFLPFKKIVIDKIEKSGKAAGIFSVILGFLSPFCPCTILPVIAVLIESGVKPCICLSFFTSASLLNITSLASIFTMFSLKEALIYVVFSLLLCILINILFSKIEPRNKRGHSILVNSAENASTIRQKILYAFKKALHLLKSTWTFILIGFMLAMLLDFGGRQDAITKFINDYREWSTLILVFLGSFMHAETPALALVVLALKETMATKASILSFVILTAGVSMPLTAVLTKYLRKRDIIFYNLFIIFLGLILAFLPI